MHDVLANFFTTLQETQLQILNIYIHARKIIQRDWIFIAFPRLTR